MLAQLLGLRICAGLARTADDPAAVERWLGAEDVLHDLGAISMMSSDSQAMGRVGEVSLRCWQTAHKMKVQRGALAGDSARADNARVKRYVAKYTINPALAHGVAHEVGSIGSWYAAGKPVAGWHPQKKTPPKNLDAMSIEDLEGYIAAMKAEIARVEDKIRAKRSHAAAAASFFKK